MMIKSKLFSFFSYALMLLCSITAVASAPPVVIKQTLQFKQLEMNPPIGVVIFEVFFDQPVFLNSSQYNTLRSFASFNGIDDTIEMPNVLNSGGFAKYVCGEEVVHSYFSRDDLQNQQGPPTFAMAAEPTSEIAVSFLTSMSEHKLLNETIYDDRIALIVIMDGGVEQRQHNIGNMLQCPPRLVFPDDFDSQLNSDHKRIVNAANEPFLGTVTFTEFYEPQCDGQALAGFLEKYNNYRSSLRGVANQDALQSIEFQAAALSASDVWSACRSRINAFFQYTEDVFFVDNVRGCFQPFGTDAFSSDPCCNQSLANSQCCAPQNHVPNRYSHPSGFNQFAIDQCLHPDGIRYILENFAEADQAIQRAQMIASTTQQGSNDLFTKYNQFLTDCQTLIFSTTCKVDSDCKYSQRCDTQGSGNCAIDWNNQNDYLLKCYFDTMPSDLMYELSNLWAVPYFADSTEQANAFWPEFQARVLEYDCVGPRAQQFQSKDLPPEQGSNSNQWRHVQGNQTGCLSIKGCNWNAWSNTNEESCLGTAVVETKTTHLCGLFDGIQYQEYSMQPSCRFSRPTTQSSCESVYGGVWIAGDNMGQQAYCWDRNNSNAWQDCMNGPFCNDVANIVSNLAPGNFWLFEPKCGSDLCYSESISTDQECFNYRNQLMQSGSSDASQFANNLWWWNDLSQCVRMGDWNQQLALSDNVCGNYNMTFHKGKQFVFGKWFNETECDRGVCSVSYLRNYPVTQQQCSQVPLCSQPCERCIPNMMDENGQDKTLCYSTLFTTMSDCQTAGGQWDQNVLNCFFPQFKTHAQCTASENSGLQTKFFSCDEAASNLTSCSAIGSQSVLSGSSFHPGAYLHCRWNPWAECRSESECTNTGRCNDNDLMSWQPNSQTPIQGACVQPWQYDQYGNKQWCQGQDANGQSTGIQWTKKGCSYTQYQNESACLAAGQNFQWLTQAKTQSACLNHGRGCFNAKSMNSGGGSNDYNRMDDLNCNECSGSFNPIYSWQTGITVPSKILPLSWVERRWDSVNQWKQTISWQKMNEAVQMAVSSILIRQRLNDLSQKYNRLIPLMQIVACDCFTNSEQQHQDCFTAISSTVVDVECRKDPGAINACGAITWNDTHIGSNVTSSNVQIVRTLAGPFLLQFATHNTTNGRRLLSFTSASYAIIENQNHTIVGQLIGDGVYFNNKTGSGQLCLTRSLIVDIVNDDFIVYDFAVSTDNVTVSQPLQINVTLTGLQLCRDVQTSGMYFPILRVVNVANYTGSSKVSDSAANNAAFSVSIIIGIIAAILGIMLIAYLSYIWYRNSKEGFPAARRHQNPRNVRRRVAV